MQGRRAVHLGSQSSCFTHRTICQQGEGSFVGTRCCQGDDGSILGSVEYSRNRRRKFLLGEGISFPIREISRRRCDPRSRNALDWRGDGRGSFPPRRIRKGADGSGCDAADKR